MKVTIITICLNSAETIAQTIASVLNQDYHNIEYLVIDGQSTDGTLEIIYNHKEQIAKILSEKDNGLYAAFNKGINLANGEIIGILNSDDYFADNGVVSKVVKAIEENNSEGVYGDLHYVGRWDTNKILRKWKAGPYKPGLFISGWMPPHPTFFVKKEIYKKYGGYNEQLSLSADYELMLRMIHKHKIKVSYIPEVLVKMRVGGKGNVNFIQRIRANIQDRRAWTINNIKPGFFTAFLKPVRKIKQFGYKSPLNSFFRFRTGE